MRDADGVIRLLGRTSVDIIKSGGYKLSALEIEEVCSPTPRSPRSRSWACPTPTWGERVTACVVPRAGQAVTLEALQAFARERLAPYKLPRSCACWPRLPRNAMGKVQKQKLRAEP